MNKTKIEWCDSTWNPVWGCLNECPYCYARKISKRFGKKYGVEDFKPTWIESNFNKDSPKGPARIFVNSMSDVCHWDDEWVYKVIERIEQHPDLTFLFLTKDVDFYHMFNFPENCWLGYTFNTQKQIDEFMFGDNSYYPEHNKFFVSLEPIQEKIELCFSPDWLIVGAESGNRKDKIIPKQSWIRNLIGFSRFNGVFPIFMKDNLKDVMGKNLIQEFPK